MWKKMEKPYIKKQVGFGVKIALGVCCSIMLAQQLHLQFAASAGTISLLTILSTKWETVRLATSRLLSFGITVVLAWMIFDKMDHFEGDWLYYGLLIFLLTTIIYLLGWRNTLSVNAVIASHFMEQGDLGWEIIWNELALLLIGITTSVLINMFHNYKSQREQIITQMRAIESEFEQVLLHVADYLLQKNHNGNFSEEMNELELHLDAALEKAYEYQENTFVTHPEYYIRYVEMRMIQCGVLHNLRHGIDTIRKMPHEAQMLAGYLQYLSGYVKEMNKPEEQIAKLLELKKMYREMDLPTTREAFEVRAALYHIFVELGEFLAAKAHFIEELDEKLRSIYWNEAVYE
jgi:uncharacterized membrane protein YgaE (UPF0421/DUF939 family)